MSDKEITKKIRNGEIDINNQSHFFSFLIKGLLVHLNKDILELMKYVREKVNTEYGVMLEPEIRIIGED